jgi:hypothetical protein
LVDVSDVRNAAIIRAMMEEVLTPETSVNFYEIKRCIIPEIFRLVSIFFTFILLFLGDSMELEL